MRITKTISIYEETQKKLSELCKKSGMGESELIREMIDKVSEDKIELTILMHKFLEKNSNTIGKERLLRIMSNRKSQKEEAQRSSLAVSLNNRLNHIPDALEEQEARERLNEKLKKLYDIDDPIAIAKTKWVDE